jgi:hypothetical protein
MPFEEEKALLEQLCPYQDMLRAVAWTAGFVYALRHPESEQVLDAEVASASTHEGFARCREWQAEQCITETYVIYWMPKAGGRRQNSTPKTWPTLAALDSDLMQMKDQNPDMVYWAYPANIMNPT